MTDVQSIFAAFERAGDRLYGEAVSQTEHALQCAALAAGEGAAEPLIAAALLHDFGHLLGEAAEADAGDAQDEARGAAALAGLFGPEVTAPIALHVAAKRALCVLEPGYSQALSPASQDSLATQGGPFSAAAAARFADGPFAGDAMRLRRWDDQAKIPGLRVGVLADWRALLERLARP